MTKICPQCKSTLDIDAFHMNNTNPDGLATACKPCRKTMLQARVTRVSTDSDLYQQSVRSISHYWKISIQEADFILSRARDEKGERRIRRVSIEEADLMLSQIRRKTKRVYKSRGAEYKRTEICSVCGEFGYLLTQEDEVVCDLHFTTADFS